MPLSAKARVEVYIPDQPSPENQYLLQTIADEFATTFGGSTTVHGLRGKYQSRSGEVLDDPIAMVYTDTSFSFEKNSSELNGYAEKVRKSVFIALEDEEEVLVVVFPVYHSA